MGKYTNQIKYWQILLCISFTWIGFVCAISFMESWLKFQAPGITLPIGLGIGRLVFSTLNKVEWAFALCSLALVLGGGNITDKRTVFLLVPVLLVLLQTVWLLPVMDARAEMHIAGADVPPSNLHFYYVGAELLKVASLFTFGIKLFGKD